MSPVFLRNGTVPCRYIKKFPVDFKTFQCPMSHVDFKIGPCRVTNCISYVTRLHVECQF